LEFQNKGMTFNSAQFLDNFITVHDGGVSPDISIVMPVYNSEKFIQNAINSILNQKEVTVEILISDDCSLDNTFIIAYNSVVHWVKKFGSNHRVLMRRGSKRLKRDHLHLVVREATSDLICQAHGDDISHPLRCAILVKCFKSSSVHPVMIFVNSQLISSQGIPITEEVKLGANLPLKLIPVHFESIILESETLIGAHMAWRRSAMNHFEPLSTEYSAYGHDRIMAFRACLVGGCFTLNSILLKRRKHGNNLHNEILTNNDLVNILNVQLMRFTFITAIKKDIMNFQSKELISNEKAKSLLRLLDGALMKYIEWTGSSVSQLVSKGYLNSWCKDN